MSYSDVKDNDWFKWAVDTVTNAGLVGGYPDGTFRPNTGITRAEFASALARYLFRDGVFTDTLPAVLPACVLITTQDSGGSGVVIKKNNQYLYILTCRHVIDGAKDILVNITGVPKPIAAKIYSQSVVPGEDLAVLQIKRPVLCSEQDVKCLTMARNAVQGEPVAIIGNPLLLRNSVTIGVVSGFNRGNNDEYTQVDAPINPGNSGGACINEKGELVGIATAKVVDVKVEGIGYITNIQTIKKFLDRIKVWP